MKLYMKLFLMHRKLTSLLKPNVMRNKLNTVILKLNCKHVLVYETCHHSLYLDNNNYKMKMLHKCKRNHLDNFLKMHVLLGNMTL